MLLSPVPRPSPDNTHDKLAVVPFLSSSGRFDKGVRMYSLYYVAVMFRPFSGLAKGLKLLTN